MSLSKKMSDERQPINRANGPSYSALSTISGSEITPPPTFEESASHTIVQNAPVADHRAPDASYAAEFEELENGDIVCSDELLSTDGEALFRFIMAHCNAAPSYYVRCAGRRELSSISPSSDPESGVATADSFMSTDFDFTIEVPTLQGTSDTVHWSLSDNEPAYRGQSYPEVSLRSGYTHEADEDEVEEYRLWVLERTNRGLPPWAGRAEDDYFSNADVPDQFMAIRSSKSLREWADEYCAFKDDNKEFVFEKVIYGWDLRHLENSILSTIRSTGYRGKVTVSFKLHGSKIIVRPKRSLGRTMRRLLAQMPIRRATQAMPVFIMVIVLLWVFRQRKKAFSIAFPISASAIFAMFTVCIAGLAILYQRKKANRCWQVCGAAYPMYRWLPLPVTSPEAQEYKGYPEGSYCDTDHRFVRTPHSVSRLVGVTEEEWFKHWENEIKKSVLTNVRDVLYAVPDANRRQT